MYYVDVFLKISKMNKKGGETMLKKTIAMAVAKTAEKMAKAASGSASHFGTYQFKEPTKLNKKSK